jgi:hypothetical protein
MSTGNRRGWRRWLRPGRPSTGGGLPSPARPTPQLAGRRGIDPLGPGRGGLGRAVHGSRLLSGPGALSAVRGPTSSSRPSALSVHPNPRPVTAAPAGVFFGHLFEHWYLFVRMAKMDTKVQMVDHTTLGSGVGCAGSARPALLPAYSARSDLPAPLGVPPARRASRPPAGPGPPAPPRSPTPPPRSSPTRW